MILAASPKAVALAQAHPLPHTPFPTSPGSATALPATRGPLPAWPPRSGSRWPARPAPPSCQDGQRPQVGNAEAPIIPQMFPQSLHFFSRLALISPCSKASVSYCERNQRDQCHIRTLAYGEGLQSIAVGRFPLPGLGIVHAQPRQGEHANWSEALLSATTSASSSVRRASSHCCTA